VSPYLTFNTIDMKIKKREYKLIVRSNSNYLQDRVTDLLNEGYELAGPLTTAVESDIIYLIQPMVK